MTASELVVSMNPDIPGHGLPGSRDVVCHALEEDLMGTNKEPIA